jgi:hypothetical protein
VEAQTVEKQYSTGWHFNGKFLPDQMPILLMFVCPVAPAISGLRASIGEPVCTWDDGRASVLGSRVLQVEEDSHEGLRPLLNVSMQPEWNIAGAVQRSVIMPVLDNLDSGSEQLAQAFCDGIMTKRLKKDWIAIEQRVHSARLSLRIHSIRGNSSCEMVVYHRLHPVDQESRQPLRKLHVASSVEKLGKAVHYRYSSMSSWVSSPVHMSSN